MNPKDQAHISPNTNKILIFALVFFVFSYFALPAILDALFAEIGQNWLLFTAHSLRILLFLVLFRGEMKWIRWTVSWVLVILSALAGLLLAGWMSMLSSPQSLVTSPLLFFNLTLASGLEELFFRGIFVFVLAAFTRQRTSGGSAQASIRDSALHAQDNSGLYWEPKQMLWLLSSSILFAMAHALPQQAFFWITPAFGILLYFTTKKARSILPALIFHLTYNLSLAVLISLR
jgi:membrane protease YdiL (CAAX protease family)